MKEEVLTASVLNYDSVNVGDNTYATIESVNAVTKSVHLKISEFVKGVLTLEHMADHPLKVIPPKLTQIGKQIKVRVFAIDNRTILFTKKDTLMKEKVPIYSNPASLGKGDKVYGVVVGQTEYGFVLRSFGGVKGLLTFDDIKKSSS
jgi:ribosomal protein S1